MPDTQGDKTAEEQRKLLAPETRGSVVLPFAGAMDQFEALQRELLGDITFSEDSVDFIREAREERTASQ